MTSRKRMPRSATIEPTDRSMPPVMITNPRPIASNPNKPIWLARLVRFTCDTNCGLMNAVTPPITKIKRKRPSSFLSICPQVPFHAPACRQQHDVVLGECRPIEMTAERAFVHHDNSVANANDLFQVAGNHENSH